nr:START domain-containing protein [Sinomicrobium weinanense]
MLFATKAISQEWELKKDKNGIKVYTRSVDTSKINEYRAVTMIETDLLNVLDVLKDGDNLWKWSYRTSASRIIKKISDQEFVFWIKNELPWPFKNRDHLSRVKITHAKDSTVRIELNPEKTYTIPEHKETIRITHFKGHWLLKPRGNKVEITQQLYGDLEGSIPAWIVNALLVKAPYHTFLELKQLLKQPVAE